MLFTAIPSQLYCQDLTLDTLMDSMTSDLLDLYENGLQVKFKEQSLRFKFVLLAVKGDEPPAPFLRLPTIAYDRGAVKPDVAHTYAIVGWGKDLAASSLILLYRLRVFPGSRRYGDIQTPTMDYAMLWGSLPVLESSETRELLWAGWRDVRASPQRRLMNEALSVDEEALNSQEDRENIDPKMNMPTAGVLKKEELLQRRTQAPAPRGLLAQRMGHADDTRTLLGDSRGAGDALKAPMLSRCLLPEHAACFKFAAFNAMQASCWEELHLGSGNMVVSAPTGAGKTVLFELAILGMQDGCSKGEPAMNLLRAAAASFIPELQDRLPRGGGGSFQLEALVQHVVEATCFAFADCVLPHSLALQTEAASISVQYENERMLRHAVPNAYCPPVDVLQDLEVVQFDPVD
ncbi:ATP-dependent DNA helicase MER3 [Symbiodinium microadriaticum]|uniref:ATP-dependent DNA helicase MER3 n=1 Tax=Symbiodinium microadriaticum TaxID=2951 RepID=A0A1Q9D4B3_SYMMI|nr:ATP-dependent DNA helicase MER3 [Symbiodinium microadriaticum]